MTYYYRDLTWVPGIGGKFATDPESPIVVLCEKCASEHWAELEGIGRCEDERCPRCEDEDWWSSLA